jgi:hypothetical protein
MGMHVEVSLRRCRPFTWTKSADRILPYCRPRDRRSRYFNPYVAVLGGLRDLAHTRKAGHPEQPPRRVLALFLVSVVIATLVFRGFGVRDAGVGLFFRAPRARPGWMLPFSPDMSARAGWLFHDHRLYAALFVVNDP